jgi:UDPglucose 6-dehydrogenase
MFVIAGYGFVGKAYAELFKISYDTVIIDPKYFDNKIEDYPNASGVVCCVGTPIKEDGDYDVSALHSVISKVPSSVPILIKSTITVDIWKQLKKKYKEHRLTFSPEFLRATSATVDVVTADKIILGGDDLALWEKVLLKPYNHKPFVYRVEAEEAIVAKQFINSFLATKVSFFNQLYDFCNNQSLHYSTVAKLISADTRIGSSHTSITTERGWGGYCFPKDTTALLTAAKKHQASLSILEEAVSYNKRIRRENSTDGS